MENLSGKVWVTLSMWLNSRKRFCDWKCWWHCDVADLKLVTFSVLNLDKEEKSEEIDSYEIKERQNKNIETWDTLQAMLVESFPNETVAIDKFIATLFEWNGQAFGMYKVLPKWILKIGMMFGLHKVTFNFWHFHGSSPANPPRPRSPERLKSSLTIANLIFRFQST